MMWESKFRIPVIKFVALKIAGNKMECIKKLREETRNLEWLDNECEIAKKNKENCLRI